MRYVLALNIHTSAAARIQPGPLAETVSSDLTRGGFAVDGRPNVTIVNLDSPILSTERSIVSVGLAVVRENLSPLEIRYIDSTVARAIDRAASAGWSIPAIVRALPERGSGSGRVTLTGGVTEVQRSIVRGRGVPDPTPRSVITGRVANTNVPGQETGTEVESRERDIINGARNAIGSVAGSLAPIVIPLGIGVTAIAVAFIVYKVKS